MPSPMLFSIAFRLDPDFDLEETEEKEEQRDCQDDLQRFLAEELLRPAAQHTADKPTDNDGDHQPHVRIVAGHQVADKGADT